MPFNCLIRQLLGGKNICAICGICAKLAENLRNLRNLRKTCGEFAQNLRKNLKTGLRNAQIMITCNLRKSKVSCASQILQIDFIYCTQLTQITNVVILLQNTITTATLNTIAQSQNTTTLPNIFNITS